MSSFTEQIEDFFQPIINFFIDLWENINNFLLQYMSQSVIYIFLISIGGIIFLISFIKFNNKDR